MSDFELLWSKIKKLEKTGVGLPVVELSTVATKEATALSAAECAILNEKKTTGELFVLKCTFDDGAGFLHGIANQMGIGKGNAVAAYSVAVDSWSVLLLDQTEDSGAWIIMDTSTD